MLNEIDAYPLSWPVAWPRTKPYQRKSALFAERSLAAARDFVIDQLRLLKAKNVVISTNVELRRDGLPRSGQKAPTDPGAAVYFLLAGQPRVLACDKWTLVQDNLWAIGKHIAALRGQKRWGVGTLDQAFAGYAALPMPKPKSNWWEILGVGRDDSLDVIRTAYRTLAKRYHPDAGGDQERFLKIQQAWEQAQREKGN